MKKEIYYNNFRKERDIMLKQEINDKKEEMIKNLQKLIQIPSVNSPITSPTMPFGEAPFKALDFMLSLGDSLGFKTKNLDGYCGYIEFGEGEKLVGIIGHLDVVPEGENWTYLPFSAIIDDNKIYGRGAIDDKGPVIASLYAMKVVMDYCAKNQINLNKRVRLILGLNEENDWKCIDYYKTHEESPSIGFSPDADFPCIYAEKAIMSEYVKMDYADFLKNHSENDSLIIQDLECHENAINVVPKIASCTLKINSSKVDMSVLIKNVQTILESEKFEIDIYKINHEEIKLTSHGIQAHAAHPDLGVNAISQLLIVLNRLFKIYGINLPILNFFEDKIGMEYTGKSLNIACEDESGILTLNVGKCFLKDGWIELGFNLRIPVKTNPAEIHNQIFKIAQESFGMLAETKRLQDALYIPKDDFLVKTLCSIYNEITHSNEEPVAIGGGTYARAFPNCISFGANLPGQKDMCHQTDEFISIDNLLLACEIYAETIFRI